MSDWRDVMSARSDAAEALRVAEHYGSAIEDGETLQADAALAVLLATRAICLELRALGTTIDYASGDSNVRA